MITESQYHADIVGLNVPTLSSSIAKVMLTQSPKHAWLQHPKLNPKWQQEDSGAFDRGTAAHAMFLERDESKIVWVEADSWRTNAAKDEREAARKAGKMPILIGERESLLAMVHEAAFFVGESAYGDMFDTAKFEHTLKWKEGHVWCRARLDCVEMNEHCVIDYKTTTDAREFGRQIGRMGYHIQESFYRHAVAAEVEGDPSGVHFVFLAQEVEPPYACRLWHLSEAYKTLGDAEYKRAVQMWQSCLENDLWPAYGVEVANAEPEAWRIAAAEAYL